MTKKLVITIAVLFSLSTILILNNSFLYEVKKKLNIISAGSYADAEIYQLNYSVEEVKDAIKQFKKEHSEFNTPKVSVRNEGEFELIDKESKNHWFLIYFYNPDQNVILNICIRGNSTNTKLAFVALNKGLDIGNWKDVNKDFSYKENEKIKEHFQTKYLTPIKRLLDKNQ